MKSAFYKKSKKLRSLSDVWRVDSVSSLYFHFYYKENPS
ncbi:hypothetical protein LEP1GSC171_0854 [Leptospira santarosai str. HAI1380]|nr:hypothetical protein LEP1GSC039_2621 [Leptospira santarosai str. 2000027870]EMP02793.1 hypothetical protein LEP1GSC171_0854 [Leptospira santarosai str. HAI1380]